MDISKNQFRVERKALKLIGSSVRAINMDGSLIVRAEQKGWKLKEQITFFQDDQLTQPMFSIKARSIIDLGATYDITDNTGAPIGSLRQKGLSSMFVQDSWEVLDANEQVLCTVKEDSNILGFARRWFDMISLLLPQQYNIESNGQIFGSFKHNYNPFAVRMQCQFADELPQALGWNMTYAIPVLIAMIEFKQ